MSSGALHRKQYRVNQLSTGWNLFFSLIVLFVAFSTFMPVLLVVSISFSSAKSIALGGYSFIPKEWSLAAYEAIADMAGSFGRSYLMTIFYTGTNVVGGLFLMSMFAYVLARKDFVYRRQLAFFMYASTLFSGGLVANYILKTRILNMDNTIWVFIIPGMIQVFDIIVLRSFAQTTIPEALYDSAKIDGANDFQIYFKIVMPLFKAGIATIGLFNVVGKWNDWNTAVLYSQGNAKLVPVMTVLHRIQENVEFLKSNEFAGSPEIMEELANLPSESTRMAITIIAILPLMIMYPFFQKYFVKGMTIGSVKG